MLAAVHESATGRFVAAKLDSLTAGGVSTIGAGDDGATERQQGLLSYLVLASTRSYPAIIACREIVWRPRSIVGAPRTGAYYSQLGHRRSIRY